MDLKAEIINTDAVIGMRVFDSTDFPHKIIAKGVVKKNLFKISSKTDKRIIVEVFTTTGFIGIYQIVSLEQQSKYNKAHFYDLTLVPYR